jgi:FixJ family two-component response regulator
MPTEPTVFVVDDQEQARKSVCALVRSMGVRGEAFSSGEEFLRRYVRDEPGCLVTDVRMLGMSGLELQQKLAAEMVRLPVIVMTAYPATRVVVRAMAAGAITLLEKPYEEEELWDAIRRALAKDAAQRAGLERQREVQLRASQLTPEERRVMNMIVSGMPNKTIAKRLDVSLRTVENRRREVFAKMGVDSVAGLVRLVIEGGLDEARI